MLPVFMWRKSLTLFSDSFHKTEIFDNLSNDSVNTDVKDKLVTGFRHAYTLCHLG